jgi:hypothetical protein
MYYYGVCCVLSDDVEVASPYETMPAREEGRKWATCKRKGT